MMKLKRSWPVSNKKSQSGNVKVADIKRLLKRYDCPMPYHAVRARFVGCIACPSIDTHPVQALAALWHGSMPEIPNIDDANDLMQVLLYGVWNPLTILLSGNKPFPLKAMRSPRDRAGLKRFSQTRLDEIDAFVDGLLDNEGDIELPDTAHVAVEDLDKIVSFFDAFVQFGDEPQTEAEFGEAVRHAEELSYIAERQINEAVRACTEARHAALTSLLDDRPSLH